MKLSALFLVGALAAGSSVLSASAAPLAASGYAGYAGFVDRSTFAAPGTTVNFQIDDKTQVPGHVLKGGSYTITVVDHLSDRMILKIVGDNGKEQALFLAVPANGRISKQLSAGPIAVKLGSKNPALRGFAFPNGAVAEFVYPKAEAVTIAKNNSTSVPAIDPASEGRPKASSLSNEDLQMVTLWMLTPTIVGSGQPGIAAQRLQVAEASVPPPPSAPAVASAPPPPPPPPAPPAPAPRPGRVPAPPRAVAPAVAPAPAPAQVAEVAPPAAPKPRKVAHPISQLPHTASNLPLLLLTGILSLFAAALLTGRRWITDAR